jgi:hypothetical protein
MSASVVEVLGDQHRRVAELFERVSSPDEDRPAVLHSLLQELAAHVAAERSAVEPVVRKEDLGDGDLAKDLRQDYDRMEKLMQLIERRKFNSPDIPDLVSELKAVASEHAERAERDLFPSLGSLPADRQGEMGEKADHADQMITTHPHPHLLSLGPIADKLTAVASRWDRLRDKTVTNTPPGAKGPAEGADPSMGGAT